MLHSVHSLSNQVKTTAGVLSKYFSEITGIYKATNPTYIRYQLHMQTWLEKTIPQVMAPFDEHADPVNLYRVAIDGPKDIARQVHSEFRAVFLQHQKLLLVTALFHDIGKVKQDQDHNLISAEMFHELAQTNFIKLQKTSVYQDLLQSLSKTEDDLIENLIRFHNCGAINMDGNFGSLEEGLQTLSQTDTPLPTFLKLLSFLVCLDRASVAFVTDNHFHDYGFLTYFDYYSFQRILDRRLSTNRYISNRDDIIEYLGAQIIMFAGSKYQTYTAIQPTLYKIIDTFFSPPYQTKLVNALDRTLRTIHSLQYINSYYFMYGFRGRHLRDPQPLKAMFDELKQDHYSEELLERIILAKLYTALAFTEEEQCIVKHQDITKADNYMIFKATPDEFLKAILAILDNTPSNTRPRYIL